MRIMKIAFIVLVVEWTVLFGLAQSKPDEKLIWDQSKSVYNRRIKPAEPSKNVNWDERVAKLLKEEPGDIILTGVGDMIYTEKISDFPEPDHQNLYRLMREADIAYGNLEMSLNDLPKLPAEFYDFKMGRDFAWEIVNVGINLVSLANNHNLDYGPEGLKDCLSILDHSRISHAGGGLNYAQAHSAANVEVQNQKTKFALLSYYSPSRTPNPDEPCLATIDAPKIYIEKKDGQVETIEGPLESDIKAMEDDIVMAKRHAQIVMVSFHAHDVSHARSYGYPDKVMPNQTLMYHKAVDAGADIILGHGPHVLRGIEIYKGKPIIYSLSNFVYQYRTPFKFPPDIVHQRDSQVERPTNVSVYDRRDSRQEMEAILVRFTINQNKIRRFEIVPVTLDDEGSQYGSPRLANDKRGREIIGVVQKLSEPYKTKITYKDWHAEVELQ